jgi:hypothetical protein
MQILFAISILCFFAIAWAAISFARHIKASSIRRSTKLSPPAPAAHNEFREHLYAALQEDPTRIRQHDLRQNVRDITANKSWNMPPKSAHFNRSIVQVPRVESPKPRQSSRKTPQSARHGTMALLDPAYFNKDSGDLTDPYQAPRVRANDGNKPQLNRRY